jgi:hypothetical protein
LAKKPRRRRSRDRELNNMPSTKQKKNRYLAIF